MTEGKAKLVKIAVKQVGKLIKQGVRKAGQAGGSIKPKKGFYNVKSGPNTQATIVPKKDGGFDFKMARPASGGKRTVRASYGKPREKSFMQSQKDKLEAQKRGMSIQNYDAQKKFKAQMKAIDDKAAAKALEKQKKAGEKAYQDYLNKPANVDPTKGKITGKSRSITNVDDTKAITPSKTGKVDPTISRGRRKRVRTNPEIDERYDWRNEINIDEGAAGALKLGGMIAPKIPSAVKAIGAGVATGASLLGIKKKDDESIIKPNDKLLKKKKGEDSPFKLKKGRTQSELDPTPEQKKANQEQEKMNKKLGYTEQFSDWRQELEEKCWPGYEKKGMKTMFGKRYPNCVKKSKKKK